MFSKALVDPRRPGEWIGPLADPLQFYRRLLRYLVLPVMGLGLFVRMITPSVTVRIPADTAEAVASAALFTLLCCTAAVLPKRRTNAIYLRSFRNDAKTGRLRVDAQHALGRHFRLSGIRDPRRRWHWLFRHTAYVLFMIRYAHPKYMNLEAGDDWKARLWRSLGEARCVLIDVSELTPFVQEEIELAVQCAGLDRVLFVGNDSRSPDEWRAAVLGVIGRGTTDPDRVQVAVWSNTPQARRAFKAQVLAFAAALPGGEPGLNPLAYSPSPQPTDTGGNALRGDSWGTFALANAIGVGVTAVAGAGIDNVARSASLVWFLPLLVYDTLAVILLLQHFFSGSSPGGRWSLARVFVLSGAFALLSATVTDALGIGRVHHAAARMHSANNLKQLGLAMQNYHDAAARFPPQAICRADGTPLLSWRVLLLPYLEENALYRRFRLDEPWDSPHNVRLLESMPRVYQSHYRPPTRGPSDTHYQLVTGPGTFWGETRPPGRTPRPEALSDRREKVMFGFDPPYGLRDLPNGSDHTLLIVEAAEAVPWTKPADVAFIPPAARGTPDEMMRRFDATKRGFGVVTADGAVRSFWRGDQSGELDALILVERR